MDIPGNIRRLTARLASSVVRGVISRVNDATGLQQVQVTLRFDDIAGSVEHFQPFGLSFHPTVGSECLVLSVGASQDNLVALAASDRDIRPTGAEEGEGGLYTPGGWKVFCEHPSGIVNIGEKYAADFVALAADVKRELDAIKAALNTHTHPVTTSAGSGTANATNAGYEPQSVAASKAKAT
jgi:phage baseplate assembly protein V